MIASSISKTFFIYLSFHENSWLTGLPVRLSPLFYRRHVHHCFLIFRSNEHVLPFLSHFNSKHPNIQFTHEPESNSSLPFLDINITRSNGCFLTFIYHKPTSTGLFTNFGSFIPIQSKKKVLFFHYFPLILTSVPLIFLFILN